MDFNRSAAPQDTGPVATPAPAWVVGAVGPDAPWHRLTPGGRLELMQQPGAGHLEHLQLRLAAATGPLDPRQLFLSWHSSPPPAPNEAGQQPRALDADLPLAVLGDWSTTVPAQCAPPPGAGLVQVAVERHPDHSETWRLQLPLPYAGDLHLALALPVDAKPVDCQWQAIGRTAAAPDDRRYLRAQYLAWPPSAGHRPAADTGTEHTLFETHGRGRVVGLIATGAAAPADWVLTWYLEGDERLLQIEEISGARLLAGAADHAGLPAFAEYIKCTLRWTAPPPPGAVAGLAMFALVEDRPIA